MMSKEYRGYGSEGLRRIIFIRKEEPWQGERRIVNRKSVQPVPVLVFRVLSPRGADSTVYGRIMSAIGRGRVLKP
jgi:hypothetical protein